MLTQRQLDDLANLQAIAARFSAEVVIIGATALSCFLELGRFTRDIDLVVALDLDDFQAFVGEMRGWTQEVKLEHRWLGPSGSIVDLVPAGPGLRRQKRLVWPDSKFEMSLVGFEHVFERARPVALSPNVQFRVAPLPVIALLKVVAFMDDPSRRRKDLLDLQTLFRSYEAASDRIFGDEVFEAELEDIADASAFLLGSDVAAIATQEEIEILHRFLHAQRISSEEFAALDRDDPGQREQVRFQQQLRAFQRGLG